MNKSDIVFYILLITILLYFIIKGWVISYNCPTCNEMDVFLKIIGVR